MEPLVADRQMTNWNTGKDGLTDQTSVLVKCLIEITTRLAQALLVIVVKEGITRRASDSERHENDKTD